MTSKTLEELARDLKQRRLLGDPPPVLLLGAGASVEAGIGAMTDLFAFVGCADFDAFVAYIEPLTGPERYRLLSEFLQTRRPDQVTRGYRALATLCEVGYFDLILTTNLDPLLDDALAAARLWRKDCLLLVNGVVREDRLRVILHASRPRLKVLKLHGDLFLRFMAWTPAEMDTYLCNIDEELGEVLAGRDLLVVGHGLRDARILELTRRITEKEGVVWYTHPTTEPAALGDLASVRSVVDSRCVFEKLFPTLLLNIEPERLRVNASGSPEDADTLVPLPMPSKAAAPGSRREAGGARGSVIKRLFSLFSSDRPVTKKPLTRTEETFSNTADFDVRVEGTEESSLTTGAFDVGTSGISPSSAGASPLSALDDRAQTFDDLIAAVVGVGDFQGNSNATGFVVTQPPCIVCDRYPLEALGGKDALVIRDSRGRKFEARVFAKYTDSPFGPLLLEIPAGFRAPALAVDPRPVGRDEAVRAIVAAGDRTGVSSGAVFDGIERSLFIDPVGEVSGLVRVGVAVRPGSSGAPVVDASFRVRGFIVGGNFDLDNPKSWMDPASRWYEHLVEIDAPAAR